MPRLIVHAGTGKTGTTSIQVALLNNEELLAERGFHVIRSNRPFARSAKHRLNWSDGSDPGWAELAAEIERIRPTGQHAVLSNEAMWQADREGLGRLVSAFEGYTPTVLLYVREQADYIQSMMLQKQKNPTKAMDLGNRDKIEKWIARRPLDYLAVCGELEQVFGEGSVHARLFDRSAFAGNDLLLDFFQAIGVPDPASLNLQQAEANPSIAAEFAPILDRHRGSEDREMNLRQLQDIACRMTANGYGSRYFMRRDHVEAVRNRFRESNRRFASTYLQNAYALPENDVWAAEGSPTEEELEATLIRIAQRVETLGQKGWTGTRGTARRIFAKGWTFEKADGRGVTAQLSEPRALIRFRTPFRQRYRHGDHIEVRIRTADDAPLQAHVLANGSDLGILTFPDDRARIPLASCEPYDQVELALDVVGEPSAAPRVIGLDLPSMQLVGSGGGADTETEMEEEAEA
jgi:hypothetical protein